MPNRQALKTHCPKGHPYDAENTKICRRVSPRTGKPYNYRICLACYRAYHHIGENRPRPPHPQSLKTACPEGHPYDAANTYLHSRIVKLAGGREKRYVARLCKQCNRENGRWYREMKKRELTEDSRNDTTESGG